MAYYTSGLELEQFLIDEKGKINFGAEGVLHRLRRKYPNHHYQKEVGRNMLEFGSEPGKDVSSTLRSMLQELDDAIALIKGMKLKLYPFATYPGEYDPEIRTNAWYELKKKILGEQEFKMSGMCTGFHFHFSLPHKSFDSKSKFILVSKDNLQNQKMVSSYNLLIAADPVLTTLTQSSPYIQGKFLAKDSRMLYYRGGEHLNYEGLYSKFQLFGGLQGYINTIHDIVERVERRYFVWKSALLAHGFDASLIRRYGRKLDYSWNPVKVNKHGTFEQRGMDANLPTYVAGAALIVQRMLQRVYDENITIQPSIVGIKEPFKLEGTTLFVPPADKVLKEYQCFSATEGLDNKEILNYTKALYKFVLPEIKPKEKKLLSRVQKMIRTKKTMSDLLIGSAKKEGLWKRLSQKESALLADRWSGMLEKDIEVLKRWL